MTENNVTNGDHSGNAAFVAVPWAVTLRMEDNYINPATWTQLYPVIASFSYPDGCFLSHDKMAAYAGMRKERVGETIKELIEYKWINSRKVKNRNRLFPTDIYSPGSDPGRFYMIGVELIKKGVWAALEQTRQVIYSVLQAWAVHSSFAASYEGFTGDDLEFDHDYVREIKINGTSLYNYSFLPLSRFDRKKIKDSVINSKIACEDKTLQRAIQYFQENQLMIYSEGFNEEGFFFPRKPGLEWTPLKERLKKIEVAQADHKISYAAKRARHAAIKRILAGPVKSKFDKAQ